MNTLTNFWLTVTHPSYNMKFRSVLFDYKMGLRPILVCHDGFEMSVQASPLHYSVPRSHCKGTDYTKVEVGYPSSYEPLLMDYKELSPDLPIESVYCHVPVDIVDKIIHKHGGINKYILEEIGGEKAVLEYINLI